MTPSSVLEHGEITSVVCGIGSRGDILKKSKNLNKLLVFEALYPLPGQSTDLEKLQVNSAEKLKYSTTLNCACSIILNFLAKWQVLMDDTAKRSG